MQGEGPQVTQGREEVQGLWSRSKPRQFHTAFHMQAPSFPGVLALPPQPGPLAPLPWASEKGVVEAYLRLASVLLSPSRPSGGTRPRGHQEDGGGRTLPGSGVRAHGAPEGPQPTCPRVSPSASKAAPRLCRLSGCKSRGAILIEVWEPPCPAWGSLGPVLRVALQAALPFPGTGW